ncbi:rhamnogalacturonan acetylesterase [Pontibacter sp. E15-1]|uniref:rhamnogalacturonan acetylesterase n=1 Tax=Pontibacter sp. E15-1 TaxID=2919918 RepID=UPI001F4F6CBA|nr:rhamnogalacturonan acetylesterase [Pontibacter sp. E15-1]MCJ8167035.1 rhamnogalacturonan acetylesterase [Pontibacter sp. E15-1]
MMNKKHSVIFLLISCLALAAFAPSRKKPVKVYLIGDSTVADYTGDYDEKDYAQERYPITGWGQVFQPFMHPDSLSLIRNILRADSVVVIDKARGGRSTRTFFEEGRWAEVYKALQKGDVVLMQFGHNDAAENKPERYTNVAAYKEYLRLYVNQTREKGALPIIITPVNRNYPWKDGQLSNVHGDYPQAAKDVARELNAPLLDLTQRSIDAFTAKGEDYVTSHYFMNLPAGTYAAYPDGQNDNTHFQPEGAKAVAQLVFDGLKQLKPTRTAAQK